MVEGALDTSEDVAPLEQIERAETELYKVAEQGGGETKVKTFAEASKEALRVAEAATTPLLPADVLDLFAPLRSGADLRGRIEQVHPETRDAATIVIRPGADWAGHVPGQYLRIGIDVDGVRQWRAYSVTSPADRPSMPRSPASVSIGSPGTTRISTNTTSGIRCGSVT